ncbi:AMP-dependent synthetase/ligase [Nocardia takedensis]
MSHRSDPFESFRHSSGEVIHTLPEAFQATAAARPSAPALLGHDTGQRFTWSDYAQAVRRIAQGLAALGIRAGDTVAVLMSNRPEFHLVDTAVLHLGAIPFSIYATSPADQVRFVCVNAAARCIVTETQFLPLLRDAGLDGIRTVSVDAGVSDTVSLDQVMKMRRRGFDFEATWRTVQPGDTATIIYTSGTTGPPKGVELTHSNILAQLNGLGESLPIGYDDRIVSYLPAAHIADRMTAHYAAMVRGVQVVTLADAKLLGEALPQIRPTILFGVPRVWQKIHAAIENSLTKTPSTARIRVARWALERQARRCRTQVGGRTTEQSSRGRNRLLDRLVLRRILRAVGLGEIRFAATGAAPATRETLEFFYTLGLPIIEVWGLSEGSGVSTTTTGPRPAFGSVGRALPGVEVELAPDGEILVRGSMIMKGYRDDPDRTDAAFDRSGWLLTGDLGRFDVEGNLHLLGRKSEMMINDAGRNISPIWVEMAVASESFLIGHVVAIGDGRPFVTALITLDHVAIAADAQANGVIAADIDILIARPTIQRLVTEAVRRGNDKLARADQIKRFMLLDHAWEPGSPELTPKLSLRRVAIHRNYLWEIAALYSGEPDPRIIDL